MVKASLIAPLKSPLLPAIGANLWRRDGKFLSTDDWADFIEKREIIIRYFKGCFAPAVGTNLLHAASVYLLEITLLTVHNFRSIRTVGCFNPLPTLCTLPAPEFARISRFQSLHEATIGALLRQ